MSLSLTLPSLAGVYRCGFQKHLLAVCSLPVDARPSGRVTGPAPLLSPAALPANPLSYLNYHSSLVSTKKWGRFIIGSVKYLLWFIFLPLKCS